MFLFTKRSNWLACASVLALAFAVVVASSVSTSFGQGSARVPKEEYYLAFAPYDAGEYEAAARAFREAARGGIRSTEGLWIDSICYHTMIGECLYQMGDLSGAADQYKFALNLFLTHQNWMQRVEFPAAIEPSPRVRRQLPWGASTRPTRIGNFPHTMQTLQGRLDNDRVLQNGGVVALPQLFPVDAKEVVRCTAVAIRRRKEILGPTGAYDPLLGQVVQALSRRPAPPNHWAQTWIDVKLGLAYAGTGKGAQAISQLAKSLVVSGGLDHPLTPMALLELGHLAFAQGQYQAAARYYLETTYVADAFGQIDLMEEAFRGGYLTYLVSGGKGMYPPLALASAWARRDAPKLDAALSILAAENAAILGETKSAVSFLENARRVMNRRAMMAGLIGTQFQYQTALVNFQASNVAVGSQTLGVALGMQRKSSPRLLQIAVTDGLFSRGVISQRVAADLYDQLLAEPTPADWTVRPQETLAVESTPHDGPMENWFEITFARKEFGKAMEIADRIRRHRFHSTLPLGGRLMQLRWLLEGPDEIRTQRANLQRQDLLAKFRGYAALSERAATMRRDLSQLPIVPADEAAADRQAALIRELKKTSLSQETVLHEIAVRREPADAMFPPSLAFKEVQDSLAPGQKALVFFATRRNLFAFQFDKTRYSATVVEKPNELRASVSNLLRDLGNLDKNVSIDGKRLASLEWTEHARSIWRQLLGAGADAFLTGVDELIIVPDGLLWYLPFEVLPARQAAPYETILSRVRVRYAPTMSLITPDRRGPRQNTRTALVGGQLFPREDAELAQQSLRRIEQAAAGTVLMAASPGSLETFSSTLDRLIVMNDLDGREGDGPYDWAPMRVAHERSRAPLAAWMGLPWGGPEQIVLAGFHTPAENGLKSGGTGAEIFLSLCGLMSTGTRSVLMTRWRTGGQSSYGLIREYAQELPHTSASRAWQRSVHLLGHSPLDPLREPRIRVTADTGPIDGAHPFFWAGYLLADTGAEPHEN